MKKQPHAPNSHSTNEAGAGDLTTVELLWLENRIENRVRFGRPVLEKILDHNRRVLSFSPGSVFAFVRWTSNDFGTVLSRIDILRAVTPGQPYSTLPWITPGGESLTTPYEVNLWEMRDEAQGPRTVKSPLDPAEHGIDPLTYL